jgi:hypothetical protein
MHDSNGSNRSWRWCLPAAGLLATLTLSAWGQTQGPDQAAPKYTEESFVYGEVKIKVGQ